MKKNYKEDKFFMGFLSFASALLSPLIIMLGWNWFIHPLGVVSINYIWGFGIETLFNYILYSEPIYALGIKRINNNNADVILNNLVYEITALLIMFVTHFYL